MMFVPGNNPGMMQDALHLRAGLDHARPGGLRDHG